MNPVKLMPEILELIEKISMIADELMENRAKGIRNRVEVILKNDKITEETVLVPKGDPEKPLKRGDVIEKLRVCAKDQIEEDNLMRMVKKIQLISGEQEFTNPMALI